jgi:hypothetical protein
MIEFLSWPSPFWGESKQLERRIVSKLHIDSDQRSKLSSVKKATYDPGSRVAALGHRADRCARVRVLQKDLVKLVLRQPAHNRGAAGPHGRVARLVLDQGNLD